MLDGKDIQEAVEDWKMYIKSKWRRAKSPHPHRTEARGSRRGGGGQSLMVLDGKYIKEAVGDGKMYINSKGRKAKSPHPQNLG